MIFGMLFGGRLHSLAKGASLLVAELRYKPFLALLAGGFVVRLVVMIAYFPAVMLSFDSPRYARVDGKSLFSDYWMPAGYPLFLKLVRMVTDELWVTIATQHLIGLGSGVIVFLVMRHLNASRALASAAAAVPLLSGDHIYLEHIIMADFLFAFLVTATLSLTVVSLAGKVRLAPLVVASGLAGLASLVRSVGLVLLPVIAIAAVAAGSGKTRLRVHIAVAALLPAFVVLGLYSGARKLARGKYLGFSDMIGWNLYARVAPFADCEKFAPPDRTAVLCETTPPSQRQGPFFYVWDPESISRRNFAIGPATQKPLRRFAIQAITHQPVEYLRAIIVDLWRYVEPLTGLNWPYAGQTYGALAFGARDPGVEQRVVEAMSRTYRGAQPRVFGEQLLNSYQQLARVPGLLLFGMMICAAVGFCRASRPLRVGIFVFGVGAVALYIVPVATLSYDARYGMPPTAALVVAGLLGAKALALRFEIK